MATARFDRRRGKAPLSDMNVVPLVDVMLVLLVIFIVTAPILTHAVKIDLPKVSSQANLARAGRIEFGTYAFSLEEIPDTVARITGKYGTEA